MRSPAGRVATQGHNQELSTKHHACIHANALSPEPEVVFQGPWMQALLLETSVKSPQPSKVCV